MTVCVFIESSIASASNIFVSRINGQDRDGCGLYSKPCLSISYALQHAVDGSTVYLDGTGTSSSPYTCKPFNTKYPGILVKQYTLFVGIKSRAHISCHNGNKWIVNGSVDGYESRVVFKGIAFYNSPLQLFDFSLHMEDCVLNTTKSTALAISLISLTRLNVTLNSVLFQQNIASVILTSETSDRNKIFIKINNSSFKSNGQKNQVNTSSRQDSVFSLNCHNDLIDIAINNSVFVGNFLQNNKRSSDLVQVKNVLGECNVTVQRSKFEDNGVYTSTLQTNNLFSVESSTLSATFRSLHVGKSKTARFLYFAGNFSNVSVLNSTFRNFTIFETDYQNGGVFCINSLHTCHLFIQDCFVNHVKITTYIDGGVAYMKALNVFVTVQNFFVRNVTTSSTGGIFYIEPAELTQRLSGSQLTFHASDSQFQFNQADGRGGVLLAYPRDITTLIFHNVSFEENISTMDGSTICLYDPSSGLALKKSYLALDIKNAKFLRTCAERQGNGGAIYFHTSAVTTATLHNVSFVGNNAFFGGAIYAQNVKASSFHFTVTESSFVGNVATRDGGAIYAVFWSNETTMVLNRSIFIENVAKNDAFGGAVLIGNNLKSHFPNVQITSCVFENNLATYGGAVSIPQKSQIMLVCKDSLFKSNRVLSKNMHEHQIVFDSLTAYGGALFLSVAKSKLNFVDITFIDNTCYGNQGGALYVDMSSSTTLNVTNSLFINNIAFKDLGGAIALVMSDDQMMSSGCLSPVMPVPPRSWMYLNKAALQNIQFINNTAFSGSALSVVNGEMFLNGCRFVNNFASVDAGHVSNDGSNSLTIQNTTFLQTARKVTSTCNHEFEFTSFIQTFSGGPLVVRNSTFDQQVISADHPLIIVTLGGDIDLDDLTSVSCPYSSKIIKTNLSFSKFESAECSRHFAALRLSCQQCDPKYYALGRGNIKGLKETNNLTCRPCPRGADCFPLIRSKPNFWGYLEAHNPPTLAFKLCPVGYCKSPRRNGKEYNACQGHRTGVMCGSCSDKYTEELFSTRCHLAKDCNDYSFWIAFAAFAFLMASFFVFNPPIPWFIIKHTLWFRKYVSSRTDVSSNQDDPHASTEDQHTQDINEGEEESAILLPTEQLRREQSQSSGFLEIVFYFYQIAHLLLDSYWLEKFLSMKILPSVVAFFNFQPSISQQGLTCPFPGLTPLTKKLFGISPVLATLVAIWIIFTIRSLISFVRQRRSSYKTPSLAPHLAATLETMLLGYATIANVAFSLVRCVSLGSQSRWFYNGNVECFQSWQYVSVVFNLIFVVPFMLTLAWASIKVQKGTITAKELFLATLFPLPFLLRWILRAIRSSSQRESRAEQTNVSLHALKLVLFEPFRKSVHKQNGAVYWQSLMIARRFVLVLLSTFIAEPSSRLFFMTLFNVLALFHHVSVKPFLKSFANHLESVSLLLLVIFGLMNMHKSVYIGAEASVKGDLVEVFKAYDWFEIVVLGLLPAIFLLIVFFGFVSLTIRIVLYCSRYFIINLSRACSSLWRLREQTYTQLP